ncbi:hypothetical protein Q427_02480 [Halomonas sp. BC04]|nr:hypothetical protein Q427_02480 [Halomonas sp. BC04]
MQIKNFPEDLFIKLVLLMCLIMAHLLSSRMVWLAWFMCQNILV